MAAGQSETSNIAPVKVRTGNAQQRRSGKGPSTQKYIATKVTEGTDAKGNPTFTKNLVEQVLLLLKLQKTGIFNCVDAATGISRYDYTRKILASAGYSIEVRPVEEIFFNRIATVSNNESAINEKLFLQNQNIMQSWDLALETYIKERLAL